MKDNGMKEVATSTRLDLTRDAVEPSAATAEQPPRYVSHRSLLMRDAAVWKKGTVVYYSTAGDDPQVGKLQCLTGADAKRIARTLLRELLGAKTDKQYNDRIVLFLKDVADAWPANDKRQVHVHECDQRVGSGGTNPDGTCDTCGFDWKKHVPLTEECACGPRVDEQTDAAGQFQFVIHRSITREVIVV